MKICVVIPFCNEKKHIASVVESVIKKGNKVIVVDDGSSDGGMDTIKASRNLVKLTHKINLGKGAAMKTGAEFAFSNGFDAVVFMDGDGQHNPHDLSKFVDLLTSGYDFVLGSRNLSFGVPFVRFAGNKFASAVISILFGIYVSDSICGFRGMTKKAYSKIKWQSRGYGVEVEMVIRAGKSGLKYTEVPVETKYINAVKGVTALDAMGVFWEILMWRIRL